jgi:endo-1,4-beta-xylanase
MGDAATVVSVATGGAGAGGSTAGGGGATGGATMGGAMAGGSSATGGAVASGGATGGRSGTGGAATGGASTLSTDACSPGTTLTGGTQHCNQNASGSYGSYQWQLWSNTTTGCLTTYSDGAFSANWSNSRDLLAGVGLKLDGTKSHQELGTFSADFAERKTGSAGGYSYIGVHGWTTEPNIEIYIVEESFDPPPPKPNAPLLGTLAADGGIYDIYKIPVTSAGDSITQMFSIRRTTRSCGHVSISEHFAKWTELGAQLGKMQLVEVFVESGGGTGSIDFTAVRLSVD